jgi:hypothetical protein
MMSKEQFIEKYLNIVPHKLKDRDKLVQQAEKKYFELRYELKASNVPKETLWNRIDKDPVFESAVQSRSNGESSSMGTAWQTRTRRGYRNKFGEYV